MFKSTTLYAVGAYGRQATLADWNEGKDFKIVSGPYFSNRDLAGLWADGCREIRFVKAPNMTKLFTIPIPNPAAPAAPAVADRSALLNPPHPIADQPSFFDTDDREWTPREVINELDDAEGTVLLSKLLIAAAESTDLDVERAFRAAFNHAHTLFVKRTGA